MKRRAFFAALAAAPFVATAKTTLEAPRGIALDDCLPWGSRAPRTPWSRISTLSLPRILREHEEASAADKAKHDASMVPVVEAIRSAVQQR